MNAPVSRRALLGASAATVTAVALPALAEAGSPASAVADLDAELLELLNRWGPARAAADAAGEWANTLWDAFIEQKPPRPDTLHYRHEDDLRCGHEVELLRDGRHVALYGLPDVEKLRGMPLPRRCEETYTPFPGRPGDQIVHRTWLPDERRIARRAEVIAAHDAWMVERQAVKDRLGMDAADAVEEEACEALCEIEARILATAPLTFAGLAAKARWATWDELPRATAEIWAKRIADDVVALAGRVRVSS